MCGICRCDAKIEEIKTDRLTTLNACCPKDMRHPVFWMPLIQYTHVTGQAIDVQEKSKVKGVYRHFRGDKWYASCKDDYGKMRYIGIFGTMEDAENAHDEAIKGYLPESNK